MGLKIITLCRLILLSACRINKGYKLAQEASPTGNHSSSEFQSNIHSILLASLLLSSLKTHPRELRFSSSHPELQFTSLGWKKEPWSKPCPCPPARLRAGTTESPPGRREIQLFGVHLPTSEQIFKNHTDISCTTVRPDSEKSLQFLCTQGNIFTACFCLQVPELL